MDAVAEMRAAAAAKYYTVMAGGDGDDGDDGGGKGEGGGEDDGDDRKDGEDVSVGLGVMATSLGCLESKESQHTHGLLTGRRVTCGNVGRLGRDGAGQRWRWKQRLISAEVVRVQKTKKM